MARIGRQQLGKSDVDSYAGTAESDNSGELPLHDGLADTYAAEHARVDRIIRDYPPRLQLERWHYPDAYEPHSIRYPILYWGFPYKKGYLTRFAIRHGLSSQALTALRDAVGQDTIQFTPEGLRACGLPAHVVDTLAREAVVLHMRERSGLYIDWACPVSSVYQGMVVVLDNRRVQYHRIPDKVFWPGIKVLREMMNEEDYESSAMRYWSWENAFPESVHSLP